MSYLRYLCLFVCSTVQHILCCVFVLFLKYKMASTTEQKKDPMEIIYKEYSSLKPQNDF